MTRLGSILFSAVGLLFLAGLVLLVRLALRGTVDVRATLKESGWSVSEGQLPLRWKAERTRNGVTLTVEQYQRGMKQQSVWTEVKVPVETGPVEVLVTRRAPAFLSADGLLASWLGQRTPPKWEAGTPAFRDACDAWATDPAAGARWLTPQTQELLVGAASLRQLVGVHVAEGRLSARIAGALDDPKVLDAVTALVEQLRDAAPR